MKALSGLVLACVMTMALGASALAHHSAAAYDTQKEVKISGTVVQYRFANPHVYLTVQVRKDDGSTYNVEVEAGAASVLNGLGFTKDSVRTGEIVTVVGSPARARPDAFVLGRELYKRDGTYVPLNIASRSLYASNTAAASTIAGTWFSPRSEFGGFLGSTGRWALTDKGRAASAGADERVKNALKDCIPVGAPALMFYPVANIVTVQRDRVVMKVDWMDSERIVYLDGRFALGPDGKTLIYSGTLEDPVYLATPVEWSGKWEYRPAMKPSGEKCNTEVASRFLATEK